MSHLDNIKKQYVSHYQSLNHLGEFLPKGAEIYYDAELYFLKNISLVGKKILDIGTGGGFIDDYLLKCGATKIDTIEIDPGLYNLALEKYKNISEVTPLQGDIINFNFKNTYDIIISFDVIEHLTVEDGLRMLTKIHSLLNQNGICIIRTDNMANIFVGNYSRYMDITHMSGYTELSLRQAFHEAGFTDCIIVPPLFKSFTKLWMRHKINTFIQKVILNLQDRRIPQCLHKDLLCYAIKK